MAAIQLSKLRQSVHTWKNKAIRRGKQLKQIHKRVKELGQSRDRWKLKAQTGQARIAVLQAENRQLHRELEMTKKRPSPAPVDTPTVS
jgi:uncharacterized coiled-coil DUF342 family protein